MKKAGIALLVGGLGAIAYGLFKSSKKDNNTVDMGTIEATFQPVTGDDLHLHNPFDGLAFWPNPGDTENDVYTQEEVDQINDANIDWGQITGDLNFDFDLGSFSGFTGSGVKVYGQKNKRPISAGF